MDTDWEASRLVHLTLDRAFQVLSLAGDIVLCSCVLEKLYSHKVSLHPGIYIGTGEFYAEVIL